MSNAVPVSPIMQIAGAMHQYVVRHGKKPEVMALCKDDAIHLLQDPKVFTNATVETVAGRSTINTVFGVEVHWWRLTEGLDMADLVEKYERVGLKALVLRIKV